MQCFARQTARAFLELFDWRRLSRLWLLLGFSTIGLWLLLMVVFCLGSLLTDRAMSLSGFAVLG